MLVSFPGKILSILNRHVLTPVIRQPLCTWRALLAPVRMNVSSMPLRLKVQMLCTVLMLTHYNSQTHLLNPDLVSTSWAVETSP